jgi:hypothetical protein
MISVILLWLISVALTSGFWALIKTVVFLWCLDLLSALTIGLVLRLIVVLISFCDVRWIFSIKVLVSEKLLSLSILRVASSTKLVYLVILSACPKESVVLGTFRMLAIVISPKNLIFLIIFKLVIVVARIGVLL